MKTKTGKIMAVLLMSLLVFGAVSVSGQELLNGASLESALKATDMQDSDAVYEAVKTYLPASYEEAETAVNANTANVRNRFILWTYDGVHIMWGKYGSNRFIAEDNNGVKVWGIYYRGFFAGFYGDEFFHGRYRGHTWKAYGLFGENYSYGRYITFPKNTNFDVASVFPANAISLKPKPASQNLLSINN